MRKLQAVILGIETITGQHVLRKIRTHFPVFKIAVPTAPYPENVTIPPFLIPLNMNNFEHLVNSLQATQTVIVCDKKYHTQNLIRACEKAETKLILAYFAYPQLAIESVFSKFSFVPQEMEAHQQASGIGLRAFWAIAHSPKWVSLPQLHQNKWTIEQDTVPVSGVNVKHRIEFQSRFFALLFWFFAILTRIIWPVCINSAKACVCDWKFFGVTQEHGKKFRFTASVKEIDSDYIRHDAVIMKLLPAIGIKRNEACDWQSFAKIKITLDRYDPL